MDPHKLTREVMLRGISLRQLRLKAGVATATMSKINQGRPISLKVANLLADALSEIPINPERALVLPDEEPTEPAA